jgi:hypothetical protein
VTERSYWDRVDALEAVVRGVCGERGLPEAMVDRIWVDLLASIERGVAVLRGRQRQSAREAERALAAFEQYIGGARVVMHSTGSRRVVPGPPLEVAPDA